MAGFADRALVQLHEPTALAALLTGGGTPPFPRLERLVTEVYGTDGVTLDRITAATVLTVTPMRALAGADRVQLTWQQQQPTYSTSDLRGLIERSGGEVWADLYATVRLDAVAAVDPGGIETVVTRAIDHIASLDDFRSRFRYLDLDEFLARRRISTVEELRRSADYVLAEVRLHPVPPFDPQDPANVRSVTLDLALAILGDRNLTAGLQAARRLRTAGAAGVPGPVDAVFGRAARPFAVAIVMPAATAGQPADDAVDALFATAGVLPLTANPP